MSFKKGDIVVIPVPFTDNQIIKKRPAVILSNEISEINKIIC